MATGFPMEHASASIDWKRIEVVYEGGPDLELVRNIITDQSGATSQPLPPRGLEALFRKLRQVMKASWTEARLSFDRDGKFKTDFSYEDD